MIGRLGQDPKMNYTPNGKAITKFSMAVDGYENGGKITNWFNVTCFDKTAENVNEYVRKGRQVAVVGEIKVSRYRPKQLMDFMVNNGIAKEKAEIAAVATWYEITAHRVEFLGDAPKSQQSNEVLTFDIDDPNGVF